MLELKPMTMYRDLSDVVILILDEVLVGTIEHKKGFRFFDQSGIFYRTDGTATTPAAGESQFSLKAEASEADTENFIGCRRMCNLDMLATHAGYIPAGDPRFTVRSNGRYVNRMGMVETGAGSIYLPSGRIYETIDSMEDLIYEIKDSIEIL